MQPVIGLVFFYNGTKEEGLKGFKAFDGISERLFSVYRQHAHTSSAPLIDLRQEVEYKAMNTMLVCTNNPLYCCFSDSLFTERDVSVREVLLHARHPHGGGSDRGDSADDLPVSR